MKMIYKIARAELQTLFYSPVAWLILIGFLVQASLSFSGVLGQYVDAIAVGRSLGGGTTIYTRFSGVISEMIRSIYLYVPLLTMGVFSREFSSGSIKLLYASPITNLHITWGKYLSMLIYGGLMIAPLLAISIYGLFIIDNLDFSVLLCGIFGIYLLFAAYAAIGIFMSSLTSYQVVAAIGTYAVLGVLNMVAGWWQQYDFIRDVTYWLAMNNRTDSFRYGLLNSEDILYYLIVIALFMGLTQIRFNAARQKSRMLLVVGRYLLVFVIMLGCGYITSRPIFKYFYDSTDNKVYTLTPNSQKIIEKLSGGLTITTYANLIDDDFLLFGPLARNNDKARFEHYLRFKPEIKMKYVYYYDECENRYLDARYPGATLREKMEKVAEIYKVDTSKVLRPEQIRQIIDLSSEKNKTVRVLQRESGESVRLRLFDDFEKHPSEPEISAALKRIAMELPTVGFSVGHGERNIDAMGDRDYGTFVRRPKERNALLNQGFDIDTVSFVRPIPEKINIVLISDIKTPFTEAELVNYEAYIARGGNLIILGEPRRREAMNVLGAPFGIEILTGCVVKPHRDWQSNLVLSHLTAGAAELCYLFQMLHKSDIITTMPDAAGLGVTPVEEFKVDTVLMSERGSWIERQTTDFVDTRPEFDYQTEIKGPIPMALAASRSINGRTQKILFMGDSDCFATSELTKVRNGVSAMNMLFLKGAFLWMSDNEVPIDVRRASLNDDHITIERGGVKVVKLVLVWILPAILLIFAVVLWLRRRSR